MNDTTKRPFLIEMPIADNGGGLVCAGWAASIMQAIGESGLPIMVTRASDSLATRACNAFTNNFLYGEATDLLIIDADIVTTGDHLRMLFSHDVELVYGTYPKRQPKHEMCLATLNDGDRPNLDQPLWEVRRAGRGYTRIKRSLLEKMKEENGGPAKRYHNHGRVEWDFWPSGVIEGFFSTMKDEFDKDGFPVREFISEDWGFCDRARQLGVPVYVDWRIQTQHIGQTAFPINYTEDMLPHILTRFPDHVIRRNWEQVQEARKPSLQWDRIQGWFDEPNARLYRELVERIPNGGRFVEVGCWLGRSTGCFAEICRELEKEIEINAVDTFKGSEHEPCKKIHEDIILQMCAQGLLPDHRSILPAFKANMRACGAAVRIFEGKSTDIAQRFPDASMDAVCIDAGHTREEVAADIAAWLPKIKPGGVICGDDYGIDFPGVTEAVQSAFAKERIRQQGRTWLVEVC